MNLLKKYIAKNKTGYFFSVLLAVLGVLAGLEQNDRCPHCREYRFCFLY